MGAWGHKTFENDTACDWIYELLELDNPKSFLKQSLIPKDEYIESDNGVTIIASAEIIHSLTFGQRCSLPNDEIVAWLEENKSLEVRDLCDLAAKSLELVITEKSELNDLWAENEDEYNEWINSVKIMINKFSKLNP